MNLLAGSLILALLYFIDARKSVPLIPNTTQNESQYTTWYFVCLHIPHEQRKPTSKYFLGNRLKNVSRDPYSKLWDDTANSTASYKFNSTNSHKACFKFRKNFRSLVCEGDDDRPEASEWPTCLWVDEVGAILVLLTVKDELLFLTSMALKALWIPSKALSSMRLQLQWIPGWAQTSLLFDTSVLGAIIASTAQKYANTFSNSTRNNL